MEIGVSPTLLVISFGDGLLRHDVGENSRVASRLSLRLSFNGTVAFADAWFALSFDLSS